MSLRINSMVICALTALWIGLMQQISFAQTQGPAAFAAKQDVKNMVVAAMSDGKITETERRDILLKAKNVVNDKEYAGLVKTMNRLSPPETLTPENTGKVKPVDKQLVAKLPEIEIPFIEKSKTLAKIDNYFYPNTVAYNRVQTKTVATKQYVAKDQNTPLPKAYTSPSWSELKAESQSGNTTAGSVKEKPQKTEKSIFSIFSMWGPRSSGTSGENAKQERTASSVKQRSIYTEQSSLRQPESVVNGTEKNLQHSYTDYSVPMDVPNVVTPSDHNVLKTSYSLEPELNQGLSRF
jgi:hypothetical protein